MYINQIEKFLDETINKIFTVWIDDKTNKNKLISLNKIVDEKNFKKYQNEINKLLEYLFLLIDQDKIKKMVKKNSNIELINNTIEKYISYYIFIFIGLLYKNPIKNFNSNIIEFSKDQINYDLKISNFFNSNSNNIIIKNVILLKDLKEYLINKNKKTDALKHFLNNFGEEKVEIIEKYLKNKDINIKNNNLIKLIITINVFDDDEKKHLFDEIETSEISTGEFMFIDVFYPKTEYIEIETIENILTEEEIEEGYTDIIYSLIHKDEIDELEEFKNYEANYDLKIQKLFNLKVITPIVDDFMMYHKDHYKYIRSQEEQEETKIRKRDDTKLKYIINKINNVKNYYKNKIEIENKLFYQYMINKRYVLYNIYENNNILSSGDKMIKGDSENIILLNELEEYNDFPYISFNSYDKTYLIFNPSDSIEAIRSVSFINKDNIKRLQTRIISNNMFINLVGMSLVENNQRLNSLKTNVFSEIINKKITNNIYELLKDKLKIFNLDKSIDNKYTFFDLDKQNYEITNENINNNSNNKKIKFILSSLYDYVLETILDNIKKYIKKENNKTIFNNVDLLNFINIKYYDLNNDAYSEKYNNLLYLIYYIKSLKVDNYENIDEYIFKGIDGNVINLPSYDIKRKYIQKIIINTTTKKEKKLFDSSNKTLKIARCQHIITFNEINKNDPNVILKFINQYAEIDKNNLYICKSCNSMLDISKYISQTAFEATEDDFKIIEPAYSGNIEKIPEYEKYNYSIREIKKIIEKFATLFKFNELISSSNRSRSKIITRYVVDLLIQQKKELDRIDYIQKIKTKLNEKTGIPSNENNSFFIFHLDNSIFIKSSKETADYMKEKKYKHIVSLIILLLIIEIPETQIYNLHNDKLCNFVNFIKLKPKLFDKQKIIINTSEDVELLSNYPVLCYLMFLFGFIVLKYNSWGEKIEIKNFPTALFDIINTMVEILNSILIVDEKRMIDNNEIYLYDTISKKYYFKLSMFKNKNIINNIKDNLNKETVEKIDLLSDKFDINEFSINKLYKNYNGYDKYIKPFNLQINKKYKLIPNQKNYKEITNLSNCINGDFHQFKYKNKNLVCKLCDVKADIKLYNPKKNDEIKENYIIIFLTKLSKKYCLDGKFHNFENNKCKYCNYVKNSKTNYSLKNLIDMFNIIEKTKYENNIKVLKIEQLVKKNIKDDNSKTNEIIRKVFYKFQKYNNNLNDSIKLFMDKIQQILGKDININKKNYNLNMDCYIITRDFDGKKLPEPERIMNEKMEKVRIIPNHPIYNTDVISINIERKNKYEAVFDLKTLVLLGYKKMGKDFIDVSNSKCKVEILYSIKNMITYFGFSRIIPSITDYEFINENYDMNDFVNKCGSYRFNSIKYLGYSLKKYITRFKNNYLINLQKSKEYVDKELVDVESFINNDKLDILYKKTKINKIETKQKDKDITHIYMKYFNTIYDYIPYQKITETPNISNTIKSNFMLKNDFSSNVILNYIIDEIIRIVNYNTNKNTKETLLIFIISVITNLFDKFNLTKSLENINFISQIIKNNYDELTEFKIKTDDTNYYDDDELQITDDMSEEQVKNINDERLKREEEENAMDVDDNDVENDNEIEKYEM